MRLHRITLRNFKGVTERTIEFAERGVTIVEGENESGKTSLTDALELLWDYRDDSQAKPVLAARPVHVDASPEVEARLTAGGHTLTYAKRFDRNAQRRSTTLLVEGPRREQLTGRDAHQRAEQLLGETVDLDLWRALRLQQGVALEQADLIEHASLSAALDAVAGGGGVGGDREATVFARVRQEFERYHTPGGRPNRMRAQLAEAFDAAQAEADLLSGELDELDRDAERVAALAERLAPLAAQLTSQRARVRALADERARVEQQAAQVSQLELAAQVAAGVCERLAGERARRAGLVADVARLDARLAEERSERERATPALEEAGKVEQDLRAEVDALRERMRAGRVAARQADERLAALRDREALADLTDRLDRVRQAQTELAEAEAVLEGARIDDTRLAAVEEADDAVVRARAAADAQAPVVTLTALSQVRLDVGGELIDLAGGDELARHAADPLELRIGDVAAVRVAPGADARAGAQALTAAQDRLGAALAEAGVGDVSGARAAHRVWRDAGEARKRARADLARAVGDATAETLAQRAERLAERLTATGLDADGDADGFRATAESALRSLEADTASLEEAEDRLTDLGRQRERLAQDVLERQARIQGLTEQREEAAALLDRARADRPDRSLDVVLAEAQGQADAAQARYGEAAAHLQDADPDQVREDHEHAITVADRLAREQRDLEDEQLRVREALTVRGDQGLHDAFEAARAQLDQATRDRDRAEARAAAAALLYERMSAHRDVARRTYAAPLREKLERLARIVFGESLQIELDDDLRVATRTLHGVTLSYDQLSGGAREQLTVLTRLACAAIVSGDGGVPLVLDDALGYSDPQRLARLGAAFRVGARDCQVIVLTCVPERYAHIGDATVARLD
jgi:hypothetical protein